MSESGPAGSGLLGSWTRAMLRWRWLVLLAWLAAFVVAGTTVSKLPDLLTNRFVLPGTETERVQEVLGDSFDQDPEGTFALVIESGDRPIRALLPSFERTARQAADVIPGAEIAEVAPVDERHAVARITTPLELSDAKAYTDDVRDRAPPVPGAELYVTGSPALEHDLDDVFAEDLTVGEFFIALPVALLILVFTFGTLSLLLPFLFAAAAITITLGIIYLVAQQLTLSSYIQNLVTLIGLGIAIDYSLIILARYREERRLTPDKRIAIVRSMRTAGRAVVFSGTAVAIGLALMLIMPLPFMQGFGIAGLIIPAVSVLCAITLLPVLMYFLTDPLEKVRLIPKRVIERREDDEHSFWGRLARLIMRRPVTLFVATALLLLTLAAPVLAFKPAGGSYDPDTLPAGIESVDGFTKLTDAAGDGALGSAIVLVDTGEPDGVRRPDVQQAIDQLAADLRDNVEVSSVVAQPAPSLVDDAGRYQQVIVTGRHGASTEESRDFVEALRTDLIPVADFPEDVEVPVGGEAGASVDFLDLTYSGFPYLIAGVLLLTFFLLMRAFRSVVLPFKAIILNLLAISAAYGVMVAAFQWGWGEPLGLIQSPVEGWVPVFMFAMLFGLSMDYEVFLVSRMREEWDKRRDNEHAVWLGLAKTGRLVTAAGLIMVAAFMGFVAGSLPGLQQFGLGLALAILIDVTIIRGLLLPSTMKLLGRWNWYLPRGLARAFRIK